MKNYYPKIIYNNEKITDISRYFYIKNLAKKGTDIYFWYTITDWISPENLAYNFYGSCEYVWIILLLNNIINPYDDWLLTDNELKDYIEKKYGENEWDMHHYEYEGNVYYNPFTYVLNNTTYLFPNITKFDVNGYTTEEDKINFLSKKSIDKIPLKYVEKITNYEYETRRNEAKRNVKILRPKLIKDLEAKIKKEF